MELHVSILNSIIFAQVMCKHHHCKPHCDIIKYYRWINFPFQILHRKFQHIHKIQDLMISLFKHDITYFHFLFKWFYNSLYMMKGKKLLLRELFLLPQYRFYSHIMMRAYRNNEILCCILINPLISQDPVSKQEKLPLSFLELTILFLKKRQQFTLGN